MIGGMGYGMFGGREGGLLYPETIGIMCEVDLDGFYLVVLEHIHGVCLGREKGHSFNPKTLYLSYSFSFLSICPFL